MAKISTYHIGYQSDIKLGGSNGAGLYNNFPVKIRAGYDDCFSTDNPYVSTVSGACSCSSAKLLKPRALVAKFAATPVAGKLSRNCAVIRFPIALPSQATIVAVVKQLKQCGAVCIDLEGEEWSMVPPSLVGYKPTFTLFKLPVGVLSPKVSGSVQTYESDALGANQTIAIKYEAYPLALTGAILGASVGAPAKAGATFEACHGAIAKSTACQSASSFRTRRAVIHGTAVEEGAGSDAKQSSLIRQVPIALQASIVTCLKNFGNITGVNCIGYKGESISRIDLLIA